MTELHSNCQQPSGETPELTDLRRWTLAHWHSVPSEQAPLPWQPLPGDAGFRRYFRVPSALAVYAPPATEDSVAFVRIAEHLRELGLAAPTVYAADVQAGYLLIEDLGAISLLDALNADTQGPLYAGAIEALVSMQAAPPPAGLPRYDGARLRAELDLFGEWYIGGLLGLTCPEPLLERTWTRLVELALDQPQVMVHRDFHSRNLLVRSDRLPGIIDFQDAVVGPYTYDLVSLLKDCYIQWPQAIIAEHCEHYLNRAEAAGILGERPVDFQRQFDWMGLQRHIKVLGVFARLWLRDGKSRYLSDLPQVLAYVRQTLRHYPELGEFMRWFEAEPLRAAECADWYVTREPR